MSMVRKAVVVFACWTFVAAFFAAHQTVVERFMGRPEPFGRVFWVYMTCTYIWFFFTPAIVALSRRYRLVQSNALANAALHTLASFAFGATSITLFAAIAPYAFAGVFPKRPFADRLQSMLVFNMHLDLLRYWGVVAIEHTISYYRQFRERELTASHLRAELAETKLEVLKRQLHPHFLFNTLNSISVLMFEDVKLANKMLLRLSELLRAGLTDDSPHEVSLERELKFLERYLDIERIRFGERLTVNVAVDPSTLDARVPNLILQPLVENAIRYGVAAVDRPATVGITAERHGRDLLLEVRDDGPGLARNHKRGVGLSNTEARLRQLYGSEQKLELTTPEDGGVLVSIHIPFREAATA